MRKSRRGDGLNVGSLKVYDDKLIFRAQYLTLNPESAVLSISFRDIIQARASCYRRVLPHGVHIKSHTSPDYLLLLEDKESQHSLLDLLQPKLCSASTQSTSTRVTGRLRRWRSVDRGLVAAKPPSTKPPTSIPRPSSDTQDTAQTTDEFDSDLSASPEPSLKPSLHMKRVAQDFSTSSEENQLDQSHLLPPPPVQHRTQYDHSKSVSAAEGKPFSANDSANIRTPTSLPQVTSLKQHIRREHFLESLVLFLSALLLLLTTMAVFAAISLLRHRILFLTNFLTNSN